jgi:hypothetical protein
MNFECAYNMAFVDATHLRNTQIHANVWKEEETNSIVILWMALRQMLEFWSIFVHTTRTNT